MELEYVEATNNKTEVSRNLKLPLTAKWKRRDGWLHWLRVVSRSSAIAIPISQPNKDNYDACLSRSDAFVLTY